jgi:hypothetical protein
MGVILYEALTGQLPFNSEHVGDMIILIASGNARTVSEVREELGEPLSEVVRKAMQVDRDRRYEDARAMRDALIEALERLDEDAHALSCPERARRSLAPPKPTAATRDGRAGAPDDGSSSGAVRASAAHAATLPAMPSNPDAIGAPARASAPSIETPRAWTVDGERRRSSQLTFAAVVMGLVLIGGAWTLWGRELVADEPEAAGSVADEPDALSPDDADDANEADDAEPTAVTLTLVGVPDGATVTFDGEPTNEHALTVPSDGGEHVVEVVANGFEPFAQTWRAEADAVVEVALTALPAAVTPMRRGNTRPPPVTMAPPASDMRPPTVLDDLDY